jgi:hypothetical protein
MPLYRILCLDGGRIVESLNLDADDDKEAVALLMLRGEKTDCELWCGQRQVARLLKSNPIGPAARSPANPLVSRLPDSPTS